MSCSAINIDPTTFQIIVTDADQTRSLFTALIGPLGGLQFGFRVGRYWVFTFIKYRNTHPFITTSIESRLIGLEGLVEMGPTNTGSGGGLLDPRCVITSACIWNLQHQ